MVMVNVWDGYVLDGYDDRCDGYQMDDRDGWVTIAWRMGYVLSCESTVKYLI